MDIAAPTHLTARKRPRQARSAVTVDAIFEATVQVLLVQGIQRLTTTRVAERAGVSVGTMYQYFPHKQALIYAVNERYLNSLAERVEATCATLHGKSTSDMVAGLIEVYWQAKTERSDVTRVLYSSAVELDNATLIDAFARRMDRATKAMFATASKARNANLELVNITLLSVIFGTVRTVFERNIPPELQADIRSQLVSMCLAYIEDALV